MIVVSSYRNCARNVGSSGTTASTATDHARQREVNRVSGGGVTAPTYTATGRRSNRPSARDLVRPYVESHRGGDDERLLVRDDRTAQHGGLRLDRREVAATQIAVGEIGLAKPGPRKVDAAH